MQKLLALADVSRTRLAMALAVASVLCLTLLAHSVSRMTAREPHPKPHALPPIEMQLVEAASPQSAVSVLRPAAVAHAAAVPRAAPSTVTPPRHLEDAARPRQAPAASPPVREPAHEIPPAPVATGQHDEQAAPSSQTAAALATSGASGNTTTPAASNAPSPATSGATQARLLSQPMPVLPDDLREQGYQLTAVAHFRIHADGSVEVELVRPTQNPRINQILLDTLHRWRFFPATENGHPVDSDQDVRVHFSVS